MLKNKYFLIISMIVFFMGFLFPVRNISAQTEAAAPAAEKAEPGEQISPETDIKSPDISIKSPDTANLTIKNLCPQDTERTFPIDIRLTAKVTPVRDNEGKIVDFTSNFDSDSVDIKCSKKNRYGDITTDSCFISKNLYFRTE